MRITDIRVRKILEMEACTRCGLCLSVCDSFGATRDESVAVMGMIKRRKRLSRRSLDIFSFLKLRDAEISEEIQKFMEGAYRCTLCGRCTQVCPVGIRTRDMVVYLREELVKKGNFPSNISAVLLALKTQHNIFNYPNEERVLWLDYMDDVPENIIKNRANTVYFVGCVSSFSPAAQDIPQALLKILIESGEDVTLLGGEEWCCGFPLIIAGFRDEAEELIKHNTNMVRKIGAKRVIFNCPSCFYTWSKNYDLNDVELLHETQFFAELLRKGKISFKGLNRKITYHDPCDLGRGMGVFEEPRIVLKSIPDVDFIELSKNRESGFCCGGGGDVEIVDRSIVEKINFHLIDEIKKTGAQIVVSACPQCKRTTKSGIKTKGEKIVQMDISEIVLNYANIRR